MGSEDISTADTMRERPNESRLKLWLLLRTSRLYTSIVLAVAVFAVFVDESERREKALQRLVGETDDEEVDTLVDSLHGNGDEVRDQLEGSEFGTFDVVFAALNYNYSSKIFHVERLKREYADSIDDTIEETMNNLRTTLPMFGPAREHIKTLYVQWSLMDLSRIIPYTAVPALVVSGATLAFVGPSSFPGYTLGVSNILWVFAGAFTIAVFPFLVFIVYILRIATVAKRTLAIGPLILRDSQP